MDTANSTKDNRPGDPTKDKKNNNKKLESNKKRKNRKKRKKREKNKEEQLWNMDKEDTNQLKVLRQK